MAGPHYHFVTRWHLDATPAEIAAVLADEAGLERWWPSVYLATELLDPGGERGIGRRVALWTKGWLPYTLRWRLEVVECEPPRRLVVRAEGDFVGHGTWTIEPDAGPRPAPRSTATYEWRVTAEKPILRRLSGVLRPVFAANHRWAMRRGEESLRLELARRRLAPPGGAQVLRPPGPTFPHNLLLRRRRLEEG